MVKLRHGDDVGADDDCTLPATDWSLLAASSVGE